MNIRHWPAWMDNASLRQLFPIIVVFALLFIISALAGMSLGLGWQLAEIVVSMGFFFMLLVLPGYFVLRLSAARFVDNETALILAVPATLLILFIPFEALYLLQAKTGYMTLAFWSCLVLILLLSLKKNAIHDLVPAISNQRLAIIIVFATAVFAACYICAGIPSHDLSTLDPVFIAQRKCFNFIPCADNSLQYTTAEVFIRHTPPWAAGGWTMGDRTPLMALVNAFISFFIAPAFYSYKTYQLVGTLLNALFLWPCVLFVKRWFPGRFLAVLVALSVVFNPFLFFNVFYTWPKLFSAYFGLLAVFFMMRLAPSVTAGLTAGVLWSLAVLSHSGAVMTLPVFLSAFAIKALRQCGLKKCLVWGLVLLLSFAAVQLPWSCYKKAHPSINTSLLFYLHYVPKEASTPDTSGAQMSDAVRKFPAYILNGKHLRHRFNNLKLLLATDISEYLKGCTDEEKKAYDTPFLPTFMTPYCAIGKWVLLWFAVAAAWRAVRRRRLREMQYHQAVLEMVLIMGLGILSYGLNTFLKWTLPHIHELPYMELTLMVIIMHGVILSSNSLIKWTGFGLIGARFIYYLWAAFVYAG